MYARVQTTDQLPDLQDIGEGLGRLVDTIAGHPGCAGVYVLQPIGATGRGLITLWETEDDARVSTDRTLAKLGPRSGQLTTDLLYQLHDDFAGVLSGAAPTAASMIFFTGPMNDNAAAIARRARRERVARAALAVPGYVRMIVLIQPDTQESCMLNLLASAGADEAARRATDAVQLLAEQEWLRKPDRVELYRVAATAVGGLDHGVAGEQG